MVTMDTYGHLFPSAREDRSAALEAIWNGHADEMLTSPADSVVSIVKQALDLRVYPSYGPRPR